MSEVKMNCYAIYVLTFILLAVTACAPASAGPTPASGPQPIASATRAEPTPTAISRTTASSAINPTAQPTASIVPTLAGPPLNSAGALQEVAVMFYDAWTAKQDLKPYLHGVMTAFGVPPLGAEDTALATKRLEQGLPLLFLPQLAEMQVAFDDGGLYTLDSFIAAASERGARQRGTHQPLTRAYLTLKFAAYDGKTQYEDDDALPAFVLALGKERAKRMRPPEPDSLWGDALLDPLQLTLLLYSVSYASAEPLPEPTGKLAGQRRLSPVRSLLLDPGPASASPSLAGDDGIGNFIRGKIRGKVRNAIQDQIEIPLNKKDAAQVSLCASILLYGHKTKVTTQPKLIYHKDGTKPSQTEVRVELSFQDDYWGNYLSLDRWMIEKLTNCKLPHRGPVPGANLDWTVSDGLRKHGNYDLTQPVSDDEGTALATWETVPETTPESLRSLYTQRDAVGSAIVRASGLVPGWGTLEKIVNQLRDTGAVGQSALTVIYYEIPAYRVNSVFGLYSKVPVMGDICALDKPFTLKVDGRNPSGGNYIGTFKFTPQDLSGGTWVHAATSCIAGSGKCGKESGSGTYHVEGIAEGKPVLQMDATTASSAVDGYVGTWPWPEWQIELKPITGTCHPE